MPSTGLPGTSALRLHTVLVTTILAHTQTVLIVLLTRSIHAVSDVGAFPHSTAISLEARPTSLVSGDIFGLLAYVGDVHSLPARQHQWHPTDVRRNTAVVCMQGGQSSERKPQIRGWLSVLGPCPT